MKRLLSLAIVLLLSMVKGNLVHGNSHTNSQPIDTSKVRNGNSKTSGPTTANLGNKLQSAESTPDLNAGSSFTHDDSYIGDAAQTVYDELEEAIKNSDPKGILDRIYIVNEAELEKLTALAQEEVTKKDRCTRTLVEWAVGTLGLAVGCGSSYLFATEPRRYVDEVKKGERRRNGSLRRQRKGTLTLGFKAALQACRLVDRRNCKMLAPWIPKPAFALLALIGFNTAYNYGFMPARIRRDRARLILDNCKLAQADWAERRAQFSAKPEVLR